jgi:hypothetical protein
MRGLIFAICGAALIPAGSAAADGLGYLEQRYVQLNLGAGVAGESDMKLRTPGVLDARVESDLDAGFAGSALVGAAYTSGVAFELEGLYLHNRVDTDHVEIALQSPFSVKSEILGGFANVKYEMVNESPLFPYVAAGLGVGTTEYKVLGDPGRSRGVLWQLKAGVAIPATSELTWDLGYRYVRSPDYESTDLVTIGGQTYEARFKAATGVHTLTAGLRWGF